MTARRTLLRGAAAIGAGATAATGLGALTGSLGGAAATAASGGGNPARPASIPFHGARQAGIVTPKPDHATVLAADVLVRDHAALTELFRVLTERARFLTTGGTPPNTGIAAPPSDSGLLGPDVPADGLTITVGVGASLFDHRYGLAALRPPGLTTMPVFPDDHLDPARCHGDLSLQFCAYNRDTVAHAVRDVAKATRGALAIRWRTDGFSSPPRPAGTPRNLLGFRDGTANPDTTDAALMDNLVWTPAGSAPTWTANGSFQVIRTIRMLVEFWDRIGISEQENLIGRRRDSGAPMDGDNETDTPDYPADPTGAATPLTSHIRRANPRTPETQGTRILRRGFNYDNGMDPVGNLDMGLLFIAYQRSIQLQFETIQSRLAAEPLTDYIQPTGGGYFLALPGVQSPTDHYASALLTA